MRSNGVKYSARCDFDRIILARGAVATLLVAAGEGSGHREVL